MGLWKWLALTGGLGFGFCAAMSFLLPPPANPHSGSTGAITSRLRVPLKTQELLRRSCYDCHSNETRWPAYSHVWPASALMYSDVSRARRAMNFSEWPAIDDPHDARHAAGLLMASCAAMQSGLMPRHQYLLMHPDARVSADEAKQFCVWSTSAVAAMRGKP
jgi:hypothetical protein